MVTLYKAVRPNGRSFSGNVDYSPGLAGETVKHPAPIRGSEHAAHYLSVSVEPGDCTGFEWPARLFEVKAVGRAWTPHAGTLPNKRAVTGLKVVRELPAHLLFGPQGEAIIAIIDRFALMTRIERRQLYEARGSDWYGACAVALGGRADRAGLGAAQGALDDRLCGWYGGRTAYGAALAVLLRHTIGEDGFEQHDYDTLVAPWVKVTGQKAHPEDVIF